MTDTFKELVRPTAHRKDIMDDRPNPYNNGNPYNNNNPYNNGNPYNNNNPYNNGNPYNNNNPYNNGNPYNNPYGGRNPYPRKPKGDSLATAALVMGVVALCSCITVYLPFIFGGIGITLAILSKGSAPRMLGKAKAGLLCAVAGFSLTAMLVVASFYMVFTVPEVMDEVNKVYEQTYGVSFEEMIDNIRKGEYPYGN